MGWDGGPTRAQTHKTPLTWCCAMISFPLITTLSARHAFPPSLGSSIGPIQANKDLTAGNRHSR